MRGEFMEIIAVIISLVLTVGVFVLAILLNYLMAKSSSKVAEDKGYSGRKWFHMCFWLGIIPYILVAGMPDLNARRNQVETYKLLKALHDDKFGN